MTFPQDLNHVRIDFFLIFFDTYAEHIYYSIMTSQKLEDLMKGKRIGYVRVSTVEQCTDRQLEGIELDKLYKDHASAKDIDRPGLQAMLDFVREDDILIVHSMDRLARNLNDLRSLVNQLTHKGVKVQFVKENLIFTGEDSSFVLISMITSRFTF